MHYSDGSTAEENDFLSEKDVEESMRTYIRVMEKYQNWNVKVIKVELLEGDKIVKIIS